MSHANFHFFEKRHLLQSVSATGRTLALNSAHCARPARVRVHSNCPDHGQSWPAAGSNAEHRKPVCPLRSQGNLQQHAGQITTAQPTHHGSMDKPQTALTCLQI
jgi:hypothetical protein